MQVRCQCISYGEIWLNTFSLSYRNFCRRGVYCYANFYCYAKFSIVFGPNFRGQKSLRGSASSPPPVQDFDVKLSHARSATKITYYLSLVFIAQLLVPGLEISGCEPLYESFTRKLIRSIHKSCRARECHRSVVPPRSPRIYQQVLNT